MSAVSDAIESTVVRVFNQLQNLLFGIPVFGGFLEGALALVRKTLFNQLPSITPVQTTTQALEPTPGQFYPSLINGTLGIIDTEGDAFTVDVIAEPTLGTVTLDPKGYYTYTPFSGFDAAVGDEFTVAVKPSKYHLNLLRLFRSQTQTVTIQVGGPDAPTQPWRADVSAVDAAAYVEATDVHISVKPVRQLLGNGYYTASVTTSDITDYTPLMWMTATGSHGTMTVGDFLGSHWNSFYRKAYQNGYTEVTILVEFDAPDSEDAQLIALTNAELTRTRDGQYRFTGRLAGNPELPGPGDPINQWDVIGAQLKAEYETFLTTNNIDLDAPRAAVELNVQGANLWAATYTPLSWTQNGFDERAGAHTSPPGADVDEPRPTPPLADAPAAPEEQAAAPLFAEALGATTYLNHCENWKLCDAHGYTAAARLGGPLANTYVTGTDPSYTSGNEGVVSAWTDGTETVLGNFSSGVSTLLTMEIPVFGQTGQPVPVAFSGAIGSIPADSPGGCQCATFNGYISSGAVTNAPASFVGDISGDRLTVTEVVTGTITPNPPPEPGTIIPFFAYQVVAAPGAESTAPDSRITGQLSGTTGKEGTYAVTPSQTWPLAGGSGPLVSGTRGTSLVLTLPSDVDPYGLVGATVTGPGVAAGTQIQLVPSPVAGPSAGQWIYQVTTSNLVASGPLTVWSPKLENTAGIVQGTLTAAANSTRGFLSYTTVGPNGAEIAPSGPGALSWVGLGVAGPGIPTGTTITGLAELGEGYYVSIPAQSTPLSVTGNMFVAAPGNTLTVRNLIDGGTIAYGDSLRGAGGTVVAEGTTVGKFQWQPGELSGFAGAEGVYLTGGPAQLVFTGPETGDAIKTSRSVTQSAVVAGFRDGTVRLWIADVAGNGTGEWTTLYTPGALSPTNGPVTAMARYGDGFIWGTGAGQLFRWIGPGASNNVEDWAQNTVAIKADSGWGQAVTGIVEHWGPLPQDYGVLVGLGGKDKPGALEWWDPTRGLVEIQGTGWKSGVSSMKPFGTAEYIDGVETVHPYAVAVGLNNGTVRLWDGTIGFHKGVSTVSNGGSNQPPAGGPVQAMVSYDGKLFVGTSGDNSDNGQLWWWDGNPRNEWGRLQGAGYNSSVTAMAPWGAVNQNSVRPDDTGIIMSLENGATFLWGGNTSDPDWYELHDSGWNARANFVLPIVAGGQDSLGNSRSEVVPVVGLWPSDPKGYGGTLQQWNGGYNVFDMPTVNTTSWQQLNATPGLKFTADYQNCGTGKPSCKDDLSSALTYVINGGSYGGGPVTVDGVTYQDPLFQTDFGYYTPVCNNCNIVPIKIVKGSPASPNHLAEKTFFDGVVKDSNVKLSFDLNTIGYGYIDVPNGFARKFQPGKYSVAIMLAVQAGPSVEVNLPAGGTISSGEVTLFSAEPLYEPTPYGIFAVNVGAKASLEATVYAGDEPAVKNVAYAYYNTGVLFLWNTNCPNSSGTGSIKCANRTKIAANAYPELKNFDPLTGLAVKPTVTPYITGSYGLFTPADTPLIGSFSIFDLTLSYENPVSATFCALGTCPASPITNNVDMTAPSVLLNSSGFLKPRAAFLPSITKKLTWEGRVQVYSATSQCLPEGSCIPAA